METGTIFSSTTTKDEPKEEDLEALELIGYNHSTTRQSTQWLFDTGSTVYIYNDKRLFTSLRKPEKLGLVRTGGGTITPQGIGTVRVEFLSSYNEGKPVYSTITLKQTLYIPGFPLNIVSGYRLYLSSGSLIKEKLYTASKKIVALLNFQKSGFFFTTKSAGNTINSQPPHAYGALWHYYSSILATTAPFTTEGDLDRSEDSTSAEEVIRDSNA